MANIYQVTTKNGFHTYYSLIMAIDPREVIMASL